MPTRLIELSDGTLVEVSTTGEYSQEVSGGLAEKVQSNLARIQPLILRTLHPIIESCKEIAKDQNIESVEIELGFGVEAEGNFYVARAASSANIVVRIRPKMNR